MHLRSPQKETAAVKIEQNPLGFDTAFPYPLAIDGVRHDSLAMQAARQPVEPRIYALQMLAVGDEIAGWVETATSRNRALTR